MTTEGITNQLYSQGMRLYQQWDEINKYFALTSKRDKETDKVAKDLNFSDSNIEKYLTKRFALWLDLRSTDDNTLHGSGRRIENASEGITIQLKKSKKWKFNYLSLYNTRCANQFRRWKIYRSRLLSFQNMLTLRSDWQVCGQTGCGKTEFVLDLLETEYAGVFEDIVILCPTIEWNKAYKNRNWIGDVRRPREKNNITIVKNFCVCSFKKYAGSLHSTSLMTGLQEKN